MATKTRAKPKKLDDSPMCRAEGCPNRWAVNQAGARKLCSAHAWVSSHMWPAVTREQQSRAQQ